MDKKEPRPLWELLIKLYEFLEENPKYKLQQQAIAAQLRKCNTVIERMDKSFDAMMVSVKKMDGIFKGLDKGDLKIPDKTKPVILPFKRKDQ